MPLAVERHQDSDQGHAIVEGDAAVEDSGDVDVASVSAVAACAEVFKLHGDGGGERAYAALVQECSGSNIVCLGENTYVCTITSFRAACTSCSRGISSLDRCDRTIQSHDQTSSLPAMHGPAVSHYLPSAQLPSIVCSICFIAMHTACDGHAAAMHIRLLSSGMHVGS